MKDIDQSVAGMVYVERKVRQLRETWRLVNLQHFCLFIPLDSWSGMTLLTYRFPPRESYNIVRVILKKAISWDVVADGGAWWGYREWAGFSPFASLKIKHNYCFRCQLVRKFLLQRSRLDAVP